MMAAPDTLALTSATRFNPPPHRSSRSPSRSPLRKSQFTAREIDPLLSNLSPESTLKALRATATITSDDVERDALTKSIADASPAEREIGIRAAVAAQKLKEWYQEVSGWSWPIRRARGWGAGFLPPQNNTDSTRRGTDVKYYGYLPALRVTEYQNKIEDIRDGIEALELEDIKDHVFSANVRRPTVADSNATNSSSNSRSSGYGRLRDFTALITATVIQALPELATLNMLLDTWNIRLSVLRQIPDVTTSFNTTRAGISTAFSVVRNPETGPLVTMDEYEATKKILGAKVASLGAKIDKLLDMLEGQEDSLPKSWIDTLENTENDYAAWVVEAEHIAIRNSLLSRALAEQAKLESGKTMQPVKPNILQPVDEADGAVAEDDSSGTREVGTPLAELPNPSILTGKYKNPPSPRKSGTSTKAPLAVSLPKGHNRGVSEVSVADSAYSGISNAEIIDAQSTKVLASPKISVIDKPLKTGREELSWLTPANQDAYTNSRPPMIQRASTASMEVVSKDLVKQVTLTRSRSHDLLAQARPLLRPNDSSQAPELWTGPDRNHHVLSERDKPLDPTVLSTKPVEAPATASSIDSSTPSLRVAPLVFRAKDNDVNDLETPELPRRSSKRLSQSPLVGTEHITSLATIAAAEETSPSPPIQADHTGPNASYQNGTLEAKIQNILNTMPTKIRLAKDSEADEPRDGPTTPLTRSSTPGPSLTISPVKPDRGNRQTVTDDVRLFHLTRSGQSRDTPPVKLFVRAVGERGERVMVRVGGGWADLAEYLREYSLHHGHRGLADGGLEVANFPTSQTTPRDSNTSLGSPGAMASSKPGVASTQMLANRGSSPGAFRGPDELSTLSVGKTRKNGRGSSSEISSPGARGDWTPPPVPAIPVTYTMQSPTIVTTTSDGITSSSTIPPIDLGLNTPPRAVSNPLVISSPSNGQSMPKTITSSSPSNGASTYVPLGAAGPASNGRRAVSHTSTANVVRDSWVEGMVDKARAVSGTTTFIQGPTTTTTTTVISRPLPNNRRVSARTTQRQSSTPNVSSTPNISSTGIASAGTRSSVSPASKPSPPPTQTKNRNSLGDMSGIRRVFLRRKSDKG